jgi:hypothetical protein
MAVLTRKQIAENPAWAAELAKADSGTKPRRRPGGVPEMNGLERAYNQRLLTLVAAGEVLWFAFNDVRLRVGIGAYFKADFVVQYADGRIECHETKGYERVAAMVRIKGAALRYPHVRFVLVKAAPGGGFTYETIGDAR